MVGISHGISCYDFLCCKFSQLTFKVGMFTAWAIPFFTYLELGVVCLYEFLLFCITQIFLIYYVFEKLTYNCFFKWYLFWITMLSLLFWLLIRYVVWREWRPGFRPKPPPPPARPAPYVYRDDYPRRVRPREPVYTEGPIYDPYVKRPYNRARSVRYWEV